MAGKLCWNNKGLNIFRHSFPGSRKAGGELPRKRTLIPLMNFRLSKALRAVSLAASEMLFVKTQTNLTGTKAKRNIEYHPDQPSRLQTACPQCLKRSPCATALSCTSGRRELEHRDLRKATQYDVCYKDNITTHHQRRWNRKKV